MRKRRQWRERRSMVLPLSLFLIFLSLFVSGTYFLRTTVEPNLEEVGRLQAKVIVTRLMNKAINEQFQQEASAEKLLIRQSNEKGQIEMVQADTKAMNLLITEISKALQQEYAAMEEQKIKVPIGAVLGSQIFSQTGPKLNVIVHPHSVSGMDFKTEFETQGINQTKYKVYITINSEVKLLAPFSTNTVNVSSTVLIAEAVILGGVPDSYVQVPEEDLLDVTKE